MAEIVINPQQIKHETGYYTFEDFLFPRLQLAGWKMQGPFMVKTERMRYMFGRMHEKGYWQGKSLPLDLSPQYFTTYFLFKPDATQVYKNAAEGIGEVTPQGEEVLLGFDAPVALYDRCTICRSSWCAAGARGRGTSACRRVSTSPSTVSRQGCATRVESCGARRALPAV